MSSLLIRDIGRRLSQAGRLEKRVLCIYGSRDIPAGAIPSKSVSRCIAKAIFTVAVHKDMPPIYLGDGALEGCCPGGVSWLGFSVPAPWIKYFVSTGTKEFAGGAAEYLKASPEVAEESFKSIGKIAPLGKYTVIQACEDLDEDPGVKSIVCFGTCEQIRNMCSLVYFRRVDMYAVLAPFGPSCATLVTYPAGMAENVPRNSVFIGPLDPTGNVWFPPNYMALGIPVQIARQMSQDLEESFIMKRPNTAYPEHREKI
ncbi:MAG: DUF169 domain-containing protein [Candidatus Jordarchaeaceae archaeon]